MSIPHAILTDIEGTTSSIAFVKQVLFPYARRALAPFVSNHKADPEVRRWLDVVATEIAASACQDEVIVETLHGWMDTDRKQTALKALQGLIWEHGYRNGDYHAHLYPDVLPVLRHWHANGIALYVYSSGSVTAQRLFFAHSQAGDITPLFSGYFDTETGSKREQDSYTRIAAVIGHTPQDIVFLSDVVEELDAARAAGLRTVLVDRTEDYPVPRTGAACNGHDRASRFSSIMTSFSR